MGKKSFFCTFAVLALTAFAPAQVGMVSIADAVLSAGNTTEVEYFNPDRANETVMIVIEDSSGATYELLITLDASGRGDVSWSVPAGIAVGGLELAGPEAPMETAVVVPGDPSADRPEESPPS